MYPPCKASTYKGQRNTERQGTNIHALSGIRTHDPSNQPAKTHTSDRTATVTGNDSVIQVKRKRVISCSLVTGRQTADTKTQADHTNIRISAV
jgi:hypothetical protein